MHPSRRKGASAEREVVALLKNLLGVPVTRRYNLGTHEDIGDVILDDTCIQVANRKDVAAAVRHKPLEAEEQRQRAGVTFAATFVRLRGGEYRVVMTPEQFCTLWREAM